MGLDLIPESREAWEEVGEYLRIVYHIRRDQEGKVVKKVKTKAKRYRRAGENESFGIFKTGAEKQMIIKKLLS